jgi:hypothetical protein
MRAYVHESTSVFTERGGHHDTQTWRLASTYYIEILYIYIWFKKKKTAGGTHDELLLELLLELLEDDDDEELDDDELEDEDEELDEDELEELEDELDEDELEDDEDELDDDELEELDDEELDEEDLSSKHLWETAHGPSQGLMTHKTTPKVTQTYNCKFTKQAIYWQTKMSNDISYVHHIATRSFYTTRGREIHILITIQVYNKHLRVYTHRAH